jgi:hypothetical protein
VKYMVQQWTEATTTAVRDSLTRVIDFIPQLLGALIVLLIGVIIAWAVKTVIVRGLGFIKLKRYTDAVGLGKVFTEKVEVVELLGDLAKWTVIIVFLVPALEILDLTQVNDLLKAILSYVPNVVVAVVVLMVGAVVADLAARVVKSTAVTIGARTSEILADVTRWSIVVFAVLAALVQLNIAAPLIQTLWTGIVAALAISLGVAFGLGGKDAAADAIARVKASFKK